MFAVCTVVVVRVACNTPVTCRPRVRIAFCKHPDWHDTHPFRLFRYRMRYMKT
nr:MAG TPA: hypothetical protein [Caudoviricetes sp.]